MATRLLVDDRYYTASEFLRRVYRAGMDVRSAFWVSSEEPHKSSLFLVIPEVDERGTASVYRKLGEVLRGCPESGLDLADIKAIGTNNPLARDVETLARRGDGRIPMRILGETLGGLPTQEVYVYPTALFDRTTPSHDPSAELLSQLVKHGIQSPLQVTTCTGQTFEGDVVAVNLVPADKRSIQVLVKGEAAPRTIGFDEIKSID